MSSDFPLGSFLFLAVLLATIWVVSRIDRVDVPEIARWDKITTTTEVDR